MHELRCFGRLAIENADGQRVQLRSRKHLALLLYLAAHRDRRHDRGRVARLFWDTELSLARHSLSQALYDLRQHVPGLDLDRTNREVGLGPEGLRYEGRELEQAVRDDQLGKAVELYDGPFAPDVETVGSPDFERWLEGERTRYRSLAEKALLRRVSECAEGGRWGEMCVAGNRLVDMNPLNEEAHRAVMRGLWLRGDREAALSHFEEHREFLDRELPDGPDQETHNLVGKIRHSDRSAGGRTIRERPRPEMVGREEEFRRLKGALSDVMDGESRFILIRGEAGIGKTRLLEEFAEVAELEDVRLLESRCYAAESDVPYGPIIDGLGELAQEVVESSPERASEYRQLGHLFPEAFGEPEQPEGSHRNQEMFRRRLAEEIRRLLAARAKGSPLVWLIEDVHWADRTSTWLLGFLARRITDDQCIIVATTRELLATEETAPSEPEWQILKLDPLSKDDTRRVVSSAKSESGDAEVEEIARQAGGNPFYARELARHGHTHLGSGQDQNGSTAEPGHGIPYEITEVLDARLSNITSEAATVLRILAVADSPVSPNMVIAISGLALSDLLDAADDLYQRQLVQDNDQSLRLGHDIVRSYVYHSMDQLSRTALHLEIAGWLDDNRANTEPGTLAYHYSEAGILDKAFDRAIEAANKAITSYAVDEAINFAELALGCATSTDERVTARKRLAEAQYRAGYFSAARDSLKQLQSMPEATQTIRDRSIHLLRAETAIELTNWDEAKSAIRRLVESEEHSTEVNVLWARHLLLKAAIREGDHRLAQDLLQEISSIDAEGAGLQSRTLIWMSRAAYEAFLGNIKECHGYIEFLQSNVAEIPEHLVYPARHLGVLTALRLGRKQVAMQQAQMVYREATERHDEMAVATSLNNILTVSIEAGNWDKASDTISRLEAALKARVDSPNFQLLLSVNQADYLFYTERFDAAEEHYQEIIGNMPTQGLEYVKPELLAGYGLVLAARGATGEASEVWEEIDGQYGTGKLLRSGVQDRYKIYWLAAFCRWKRGGKDIRDYLADIAQEEERVDLPGAARIRWIGRLLEADMAHSKGKPGRQLGKIGKIDREALEELKKYQLQWFGYFSRRWLRRAVR